MNRRKDNPNLKRNSDQRADQQPPKKHVMIDWRWMMARYATHRQEIQRKRKDQAALQKLLRRIAPAYASKMGI